MCQQWLLYFEPPINLEITNLSWWKTKIKIALIFPRVELNNCNLTSAVLAEMWFSRLHYHNIFVAKVKTHVLWILLSLIVDFHYRFEKVFHSLKCLIHPCFGYKSHHNKIWDCTTIVHLYLFQHQRQLPSFKKGLIRFYCSFKLLFWGILGTLF